MRRTDSGINHLKASAFHAGGPRRGTPAEQRAARPRWPFRVFVGILAVYLVVPVAGSFGEWWPALAEAAPDLSGLVADDAAEEAPAAGEQADGLIEGSADSTPDRSSAGSTCVESDDEVSLLRVVHDSPSRVEGSGGNAVELVEVRTGGHTACDRVVWQFIGDARPGLIIERTVGGYVVTFDGQISSGEYSTDLGKTAQVRSVSTLDGATQWLVEMDEKSQYEVVLFGNPPRVVIDFLTPRA